MNATIKGFEKETMQDKLPIVAIDKTFVTDTGYLFCDFDGDGETPNEHDLEALRDWLSKKGTEEEPEGHPETMDFDGDGIVGIGDQRMADQFVAKIQQAARPQAVAKTLYKLAGGKITAPQWSIEDKPIARAEMDALITDTEAYKEALREEVDAVEEELTEQVETLTGQINTAVTESAAAQTAAATTAYNKLIADVTAYMTAEGALDLGEIELPPDIVRMRLETETSYGDLIGDANLDGVLDNQDTTIIAQIAAGTIEATARQTAAAKVLGNNTVTAADATEFSTLLTRRHEGEIIGLLTVEYADETVAKKPIIVKAMANKQEVSELKNKVSTLDLTKSVDPTANSYSRFIPSSSNVWTAATNGCSIFAIPEGVTSLKITANLNNSSGVAFLTTNNRDAGTTPDYATGWTNVDWTTAGTEKEYDIPEDAVYLYVAKNYNNADYTPQKVVLISLFNAAEMEEIVASNTDTANDANSKANQALECLTVTSVLDPAINTYSRFIPSSTNKWTASTGGCSIFKIPEDATSVRLAANTEKSCGIAFLKTDDRTANATPDYATGWTNVDWTTAGTEKEYDIPEDAKYLFVAKNYNNIDYTPQEVVLISLFNAAETKDSRPPLGLHEMPANDNILNIIKRCRQMTEIEWISAVDLPRFMLVQTGYTKPSTAIAQNYLGTFKAGITYKGVPYGRVSDTMTNYGYDYGTVGSYVGFAAFVSSVCNPKSRLCEANVGSVTNHRSVIYATVCSGMTCYALDVPERPTANITSIPGLNLVGKLNSNGILLDDNLIHIGDMLNLQGYHTAIITDIIRDTDSKIQFVELSDASTAGLADRTYSDGQIGGLCRRKGWTREQFFRTGTSESWGDYSVYRYTGTVTYTPSPYVKVGDEFDMQRIEHFPCMPYEGEGFAYKQGYIPNNAVKLVIALDGYAYVKVFKAGTEITGSPFAIAEGAASIDIEEISAGSYEAYLCNLTDGNVTNLSYACHWSIE